MALMMTRTVTVPLADRHGGVRGPLHWIARIDQKENGLPESIRKTVVLPSLA
jgi:hypothetical protein